MDDHFSYSQSENNYKFSKQSTPSISDWLKFIVENKDHSDFKSILDRKVEQSLTPIKTKIVVCENESNKSLLSAISEFGGFHVDIGKLLKCGSTINLTSEILPNHKRLVTIEEFGSCEVSAIIDNYTEQYCDKSFIEWLPKTIDIPGHFGYHRRSFMYQLSISEKCLGTILYKTIGTKVCYPDRSIVDILDKSFDLDYINETHPNLLEKEQNDN